MILYDRTNSVYDRRLNEPGGWGGKCTEGDEMVRGVFPLASESLAEKRDIITIL